MFQIFFKVQLVQKYILDWFKRRLILMKTKLITLTLRQYLQNNIDLTCGSKNYCLHCWEINKRNAFHLNFQLIMELISTLPDIDFDKISKLTRQQRGTDEMLRNTTWQNMFINLWMPLDPMIPWLQRVPSY